jgi:peptidoglycan/LPS O-acetylase OafA/YrhL
MRLEQLTFTRFIAVFTIVIFHFGTKIYPFNIPVINFLFTSANVGVSYIYILSGFVMIIAYHQKKETGIQLKTFYKARFARIYPVYLLALFITIAYYIIENRVYTKTDIILNLLAIQAWVPNYALSLNTPGWSVSAEIFFYILFPFLFNRLYRKFETKKLIYVATIIWLITQFILNIGLHTKFYKGFPSASHDLLFYFPLMHLNEFLIGNITGLLFANRKNTTGKKNDWFIIAVLILFIVALKFLTQLNFHDGLFAVFFVPFIYLLSVNNHFITRIFTKRTLVFLGEISYALFILQKPFFLFGRKYLLLWGIKNTTAAFYIITAALLLFSAITYAFIETPVRKKILSC